MATLKKFLAGVATFITTMNKVKTLYAEKIGAQNSSGTEAYS